MNRKFVSSLLVLFFMGNIFVTSCGLFFSYLKTYTVNDENAIGAMINFSAVKNISKDFVDVCSAIGNMLNDCKNNDKTVPTINQKETNYSFPSIFIDKFVFNSYTSQYKYSIYSASGLKVYSMIKKHIVDKPDRTSDIFLLLLLQILIYLIVLNMCKYFIKFNLDTNRITLSLRTV